MGDPVVGGIDAVTVELDGASVPAADADGRPLTRAERVCILASRARTDRALLEIVARGGKPGPLFDGDRMSGVMTILCRILEVAIEEIPEAENYLGWGWTNATEGKSYRVRVERGGGKSPEAVADEARVEVRAARDALASAGFPVHADGDTASATRRLAAYREQRADARHYADALQAAHDALDAAGAPTLPLGTNTPAGRIAALTTPPASEDCCGEVAPHDLGDADRRGSMGRWIADHGHLDPRFPTLITGFASGTDCEGDVGPPGEPSPVTDPDDGSDPEAVCLCCGEPSVYTSATGVDLCRAHLDEAKEDAS